MTASHLEVNLLKHDETPQFVNYGENKAPICLVFCGWGDNCHKLCKENKDVHQSNRSQHSMEM